MMNIMHIVEERTELICKIAYGKSGAEQKRRAIRSECQRLCEDIKAALTDMEREDLTDKVFIIKHGLFYRPDARGYTTDPNSAGVYSRDEAAKHLEGCPELSIVPAYRLTAWSRPSSLDESAVNLYGHS